MMLGIASACSQPEVKEQLRERAEDFEAEAAAKEKKQS